MFDDFTANQEDAMTSLKIYLNECLTKFLPTINNPILK